mmetsp:Transcript_54068/g.118310  ORF Transcript_54068/g.118310 Transcript_54068/m.118310 type:complete len:245 (-) Transcript_54068:43-777(-)
MCQRLFAILPPHFLHHQAAHLRSLLEVSMVTLSRQQPRQRRCRSPRLEVRGTQRGLAKGQELPEQARRLLQFASGCQHVRDGLDSRRQFGRVVFKRKAAAAIAGGGFAVHGILSGLLLLGRPALLPLLPAGPQACSCDSRTASNALEVVLLIFTGQCCCHSPLKPLQVETSNAPLFGIAVGTGSRSRRLLDELFWNKDGDAEVRAALHGRRYIQGNGFLIPAFQSATRTLLRAALVECHKHSEI